MWRKRKPAASVTSVKWGRGGAAAGVAGGLDDLVQPPAQSAPASSQRSAKAGMEQGERRSVVTRAAVSYAKGGAGGERRPPPRADYGRETALWQAARRTV